MTRADFITLWRRYEEYRATPFWEREEREVEAIGDWEKRGAEAVEELQNELGDVHECSACGTVVGYHVCPPEDS